MNCPLCGKKTIVHTEVGPYTPGPSFSCPILVEIEQLNQVMPHYTKEAHYGSYYEETVILLPYKIVNVYEHTERRKPFCRITKLKLVDTAWGKRFMWEPVMLLNYTIGILSYKKMRDRINNLILLS